MRRGSRARVRVFLDDDEFGLRIEVPYWAPFVSVRRWRTQHEARAAAERVVRWLRGAVRVSGPAEREAER